MADKPQPIPDLSAEQQKAFVAWVNTKWGDGTAERPVPKCEMCGTSKWDISTQLVTPLILQGTTITMAHAVPQVMVICANCGNTKYVQALTAGIVSREIPKTEPEKK